MVLSVECGFGNYGSKSDCTRVSKFHWLQFDSFSWLVPNGATVRMMVWITTRYNDMLTANRGETKQKVSLLILLSALLLEILKSNQHFKRGLLQYRSNVDVPYEDAACNQFLLETPQWTVNGFIITVFVDSSHEEDKETWRSRWESEWTWCYEEREVDW